MIHEGVLRDTAFVVWQVSDGCVIANLNASSQNKLEDVNIVAFFTDMTAYLKRDVPFSWVIDTSNFELKVSLPFVPKIIKFMKENKEKIMKNMVRTVLIMDSSVIKTLLKSLFAVHPPVTPFEVVKDRHLALVKAINPHSVV